LFIFLRFFLKGTSIFLRFTIPTVFISGHFSWIVCPSILSDLLLLVLRTTSPRPVFLGMLIRGIAIEIAAHLFCRKLKVDLSWFHVDDHASGVEEQFS
jgi:hypothetical protein